MSERGERTIAFVVAVPSAGLFIRKPSRRCQMSTGRRVMKVDMIVCDGRGVCAELFPERISLDDWGYPIVDTTPFDADLLAPRTTSCRCLPSAGAATRTDPCAGGAPSRPDGRDGRGALTRPRRDHLEAARGGTARDRLGRPHRQRSRPTAGRRNSRLTATVGTVLLVALLVEGVTVFDVNGMFVVHAFVGLFLVPVAVLKLGSTAYRFVKYYRGAPAYRRRGPPHPILAIIAPLVVLSTMALLGSGIALLPRTRRARTAWSPSTRRASIVWVSLMTVHVLAHIVETWRLTVADLRTGTGRMVPRIGLRRCLVVLSLVVGLGLGVASLGWDRDWVNRRHDRPLVESR